jgi:hypothetical protein
VAGRVADPVRPGQAGPKGVRGPIIFMKFGTSSSGCDPRPAKGEPAQPVASLATDAATRPAMRRRAKVWAVGMQPRKAIVIPGAEGVGLSKGEGGLPVTGRGESAPGGVYDHGTQQEDGPGTWEAHALPRHHPERRRPGDHSPTRHAPVDARAAGRRHAGGSAQKKHPRRGRLTARGDRSRGRRERGSRRAAYER